MGRDFLPAHAVSFPGGKVRPGRAADHSPPWKRRAMPLPILWATTGHVTGTLYHFFNTVFVCVFVCLFVSVLRVRRIY